MTASSRPETDQAKRPVAVINKPHDDVLGLLIGEHSKSSIGARFNTGNGEYQADKAVETARKVMARRKVEMSAVYKAMFRAAAGE